MDKKYTSENWDTISRNDTDEAVRLLAIKLNLSGASIGGMDLYRLVHFYLVDETIRREINKILDKNQCH